MSLHMRRSQSFRRRQDQPASVWDSRSHLERRIRPQHLYINPNGTIEGTVTIIERLGTETIVELNATDGTLFRLASSEGSNLEIGQTVKFGFETGKAHLF